MHLHNYLVILFTTILTTTITQSSAVTDATDTKTRTNKRTNPRPIPHSFISSVDIAGRELTDSTYDDTNFSKTTSRNLDKPTTSTTYSNNNVEEITTLFGTTTGQNGNMFDVEALKDLTIIDMDIHLISSLVERYIEVYTRRGGFFGHENSDSGWEMIACTSVIGSGLTNPTTLYPGGLVDVKVDAMATQAFYVTTTGGTYMAYSLGDEVGKIYSANQDLQVLEGIGNLYPFGQVFKPRVWNGTLYYKLGYNNNLPVSNNRRLQGIIMDECMPSNIPTSVPTTSVPPSERPSRLEPSSFPSISPSKEPTLPPSPLATVNPSTSIRPSSHPTSKPSNSPSSLPSNKPTLKPTYKPSATPTSTRSYHPTNLPSFRPTHRPTLLPTINPSSLPSFQPSHSPSSKPSFVPSNYPTSIPSNKPSTMPSTKPSSNPSTIPSDYPTLLPSRTPSIIPSSLPSTWPSINPTGGPSYTPTALPSNTPSTHPSNIPSTQEPSIRPSLIASVGTPVIGAAAAAAGSASAAASSSASSSSSSTAATPVKPAPTSTQNNNINNNNNAGGTTTKPLYRHSIFKGYESNLINRSARNVMSQSERIFVMPSFRKKKYKSDSEYRYGEPQQGDDEVDSASHQIFAFKEERGGVNQDQEVVIDRRQMFRAMHSNRIPDSHRDIHQVKEEYFNIVA